MNRAMPSLLLINLLAVLLLTGCETYPTLDGDATAGNIAGELGNPVRRRSPADVYIQLGTGYLNAGQLNEAFLNARKAILVDDKSSAAHNLLGVIYQRLDKAVLAHKHYEKAVDLDKRNPYALNALGQFLCAQKDYAQAQVYFKRALANPLYPTPWVAAHNAGACYERTEKNKEAEMLYRQALQANPQFVPSLLRMAQLSYTRERYMSARAYIQRYAQLVSHTAESLWLGMQTEIQLGDKGLIAQYEQQLKRDFPDSEQAKHIP